MRNVILRRCGFCEAAFAPQDDVGPETRFVRTTTGWPPNNGVGTVGLRADDARLC